VPTLLAEHLRDLLVGRKSFQAGLREDESSVDGDLENPTFRRHEFDLCPGKCLLKFGGQTGRLRQVISLHAVLDRDLHWNSSRGSGDDGFGG